GGGKSLNFSDTPRLDVQGTNQLDTVREINDNYFAPGTGGATLENTRFGLPYDGGDIQIDGTNLLFFDFYLPLDYDLSRLSFAQQNIVRHYYLDRNDRLVYDQWTHDIVVTVPDLGTILIEDLTTRKEIFGGSRFRLDFYAFDLDATRTLLTAIVPPDAESQEFRESTTEFTYEGGLNFSGGPGNDIIAARSDGPHSYDLGNGDDTFISLDINSSAYGGAGDDAFFGGTAFDFFTGDAGDDDFYATVGGDVYVGGAGEDTLHWASDTALITSGPDTRFYGGGGSDTVLIDISSVDLTLDMGQELGRRLNFLREFEDSELGADNYIAFRELGLFLWDVEEIRVTLDGSAANIFYDRQGTGASDLIFNDAGRSEISGRGGNDIIYGDALGDRLGGGAGEDLIFGLDGNDTVEGDAGFDYLYGGDGNDTLEGGDDTDYLYGGRGDDLFVMGRDADFSDGGDGVDTVSYADAGGGIELYVTRPLDNGGWAVGDSFSQVEILLGSDHDDTIHLGLERIEVQGRGGSDRIVAGAGDAVVFGGSGRDFLTGGSGENWLDGGTGADVFFGGLGRDTYAGGQGTDTVSYAGAVAGVTADLAQPQGNGGVATGDYYLSIENLNGSGRGDTLSGDHKGNVIRGLGGGDTIYGGAGRDTVIGGSGGDEIYSGSGWDEMTGGSGNDWFYFQKGDGRDRITDFEDGADRLFFDSAFGTRAEILARASQVDGDVVFNLGNDKLTLELTDIALIGEADILFI
ncbi:MAG: calcium-binding protein, partial [Pseudomonadota bacterium]